MKIIKVHDCFTCQYYMPYVGDDTEVMDYCSDSKRYFTHTADTGIPEWCLLEEADDGTE